MFYFHKVEYVQYLGEVDIFHIWVQKFIPLHNSAKIMKIDRDFPKLLSQMYCHLFYGSQCMCVRSARCEAGELQAEVCDVRGVRFPHSMHYVVCALPLNYSKN